MGLGWILERLEGLCIGYWRDQGIQDGYWRNGGVWGIATGRSKPGPPLERSIVVCVCACVSGFEATGGPREPGISN